jgi:hypothetical protein
VDATTERAVRHRAGKRCEYCLFPEALARLPFHIDHVVAEQHGGLATLENLALSCCYCNRYKGLQHCLDIPRHPVDRASEAPADRAPTVPHRSDLHAHRRPLHPDLTTLWHRLLGQAVDRTLDWF